MVNLKIVVPQLDLGIQSTIENRLSYYIKGSYAIQFEIGDEIQVICNHKGFGIKKIERLRNCVSVSYKYSLKNRG